MSATREDGESTATGVAESERSETPLAGPSGRAGWRGRGRAEPGSSISATQLGHRVPGVIDWDGRPDIDMSHDYPGNSDAGRGLLRGLGQRDQ